MNDIVCTTNVEVFIRRCATWTGAPSFWDIFANGVLLSLIIDGHDAVLLDTLAHELSLSPGDTEKWLQRRELPERRIQHQVVIIMHKQLDEAYRERLLRDPLSLKNLLVTSPLNEGVKLN